MKRFSIYVIVLMVLFIFSPLYTIAYDWTSEEGSAYMLNEDYQIKKAIDACVNLYGYTPEAKQCSYNAAEAYEIVIAGIIMTIEADEAGIDMREAELCLSKAVTKYWNTSTNTANWYRVEKFASECLEMFSD